MSAEFQSEENDASEQQNEPAPVVRDDGAIDVIAFAREATIRDQISTYAGSVKVLAPAKVNLLLDIGAKQEDGYHKARSIMHALMLHDVLYVRVRPLSEVIEGPVAQDASQSGDAPLVRVVCVGTEGVEPPAVASEDNIATKAALLLAKVTGLGAGECVEIRIEKHIPFQAGLGGGSSDAAAVLVALASIWGIDADDPRILECAQQLGADVPFFLKGGCVELEGNGDVLRRVLRPAKDNVVLVKPPLGLSTAAVYREFDAQPESVAPEAENQQPTEAAAVIRANNLQPAALRLLPQLKAVMDAVAALEGVNDVLLCGSGSAICAFCDSFQDAMRVSAEAGTQGCWTRVTSLANLRASVVPNRK